MVLDLVQIKFLLLDLSNALLASSGRWWRTRSFRAERIEGNSDWTIRTIHSEISSSHLFFRDFREDLVCLDPQDSQWGLFPLSSEEVLFNISMPSRKINQQFFLLRFSGTSWTWRFHWSNWIRRMQWDKGKMMVRSQKPKKWVGSGWRSVTFIKMKTNRRI